MNKIFKKVFFLLIISLAIFILFDHNNYDQNSIKALKNISIIDAKEAIANEYLKHKNIKDSTDDTDGDGILNSDDDDIDGDGILNSDDDDMDGDGIFNNQEKKKNDYDIYTIVEFNFKKKNCSLIPLLVKNGYPFYVFQNNHLIYSQEKNTYYKGKSIENEKYYFANTELWKNQVLHQIPIHSEDPLYILIRKEQSKKINDFISIPKIKEKKIKNLKETNIPIIKINTHNKHLDTDEYRFTSANIITNQKTISLDSKMKIRGNSSINFQKKQFNIVFEEKNQLNELELKKNVLISSYIDRSLMRNKIAHHFFALFKKEKCPSQYIHLIINDIYEGLYLIIDHPDQKFDQLVDETTNSNFLIQIDRGPFDFYDKDNIGYEKIKSAFDSFKKDIYNENFNQIDINSFIDFIILNELSKNIDAYRLSTYLSFIDNKVNMDIIWDFDLTFGLGGENHEKVYHHEGFVIESDIKEYIPKFWHEIWKNKFIQEKIKKRYQELRKDILSIENIDNYINILYSQIEISAKKNFERWEIIGKDIWANKFKFKSYKEEVDYLRAWIHKRIDFLDSKWN